MTSYQLRARIGLGVDYQLCYITACSLMPTDEDWAAIRNDGIYDGI